MPLPPLKAHHAADANARDWQKRVLLGEDPEKAAHDVGGPVQVLERNDAGQALARAVEPEERLLLLDTVKTDPYVARRALESREGRAAWLAGVATGAIKFEGAFGTTKAFPPAVRVQAAKLLMQMHGDLINRHEIKVEQDSVFVFAIPDNGRVPERLIVDAPPTEE